MLAQPRLAPKPGFNYGVHPNAAGEFLRDHVALMIESDERLCSIAPKDNQLPSECMLSKRHEYEYSDFSMCRPKRQQYEFRSCFFVHPG